MGMLKAITYCARCGDLAVLRHGDPGSGANVGGLAYCTSCFPPVPRAARSDLWRDAMKALRTRLAGATVFAAADEPEIHDAGGVMNHGSGPCTVRKGGAAALAFWCMALFVAPQPASAAGEFVWPVNGSLTATTVYPGGADHQGASADIAAPMWAPIGASRAGSSSAFWEGGGCGNYAWITHPAGYITLYCHLVNRPTTGYVGNNQTIGYIGVTGNTTGPHVHWAIRRYNVRMYVPGSYIGMRVARGQACAGSYPGLTGSAVTGAVERVIPPANYVMYRLRLGIGLNVHNGPGWNTGISGVLRAGTIVDVYGFVGGWLKIWYGGGWKYVANLKTVKTGLSVQITQDCRVETGYGLAGWLPKNAIIHCWAWSNHWYRVWWNGNWRWIHSMYTRAA